MSEMIPVKMNQYGPLMLPEHRQDQWQNPWEKERLDSMHANIQPGDTVFYCGAEEFDMPALIASWGARLVMIEPSEKYWPAGKQIWEANTLPEPLATFRGFAAHKADGQGTVFEGTFPPEADGELVPIAGFSNLSERPDIPRVALDDLVTDNVPAPNVISIDTEGSELHILRGAMRILQEHRPLVYVSVHPEFMKQKHGQDQQQIFDLMGSLSYANKLLAKRHEDHYVFFPVEGIATRRFIET